MNVIPAEHGQTIAPLARLSARHTTWLDRIDDIWQGLYTFGVVAGCVFLFAPFVVVFVISISAAPSVEFPPPSFTLTQYTRIPPDITAAFWRSLRLGLLIVSIDLALCVPAAFALARGRLPGRSLVEAFFRGPVQVPGIVMAVAFYLSYSALLRSTGINLRNEFAGLVIAHVVMTFPYMLATVVVRLYTMGPQLEEASYGLGAGFFRTMWRVTIPQMRPALIAGSFLAFVISFEDVPVALFLAPGASTSTLPVQMFQFAVDSLSPALFAAAILVLLFSMALVVAIELLVGLKRVLSDG
jgi:putative spermidine/putrescine transport system permease protein